ncbi:MAG: alpha amylase C-terminal domain-containing protein [Phycisphaerales bacterium]|nr:alpha amylase C-terminal domain-containing protein [Phycisphaerales bacterium]
MRLGCLLGVLAGVAGASATGPDGNVEWDGISHVAWLDRRPLCPVGGEAFVVRFQAFRNDLVAARVHLGGHATTVVEAQVVGQRGPYDLWEAPLPATTPTASLTYYLELLDPPAVAYCGPSGVSSTPPSSGWTIDFATLAHAPYGGTLTSDGGAVFRVWAPGAPGAWVAGQFNGWSGTSLPMQRVGGDFLRRVLPPVQANQQYKYRFSGLGTWRPDARGRALNPQDNLNTFLVDPHAFAWSNDDFSVPPFEEMVIYELHVGTFSGLNDGLNRMGRYRDVVDRHLDHLLDLGVNVVQLMPITEFAFHQSWGYNPISHWAPEHAYGTPDDLKYLIDRLNRAGIAVTLDIVYNHFSPSDNFMWQYDGTQIYFDVPAVETPWGAQAAFWKQEVRDYFADNVLLWLDEYRFNGFRMDATRFMRDNWIFPQGYPAGWGLMQEINRRIRQRAADAISIAEELPNEVNITVPVTAGGAGFDSQWDDHWKWTLRGALVDAAFGNPNMGALATALNASSYPNKTQLVRYIESHDEAGNYERLTMTLDSANPLGPWAVGRSKLGQGLTMFVPGIPMFLMGGEWLEEAAFGSGAQHRLDWAKASARTPLLDFFRAAIGLRRSQCGLRSDAPYGIYHVNQGGRVLAFWRGLGREIVVLAHLGNSDHATYQIGLPHSGTWYELLNSQDVDYWGSGSGNGGVIYADGGPLHSQPASAWITVPAMGLLVLRHEAPRGRSADLTGDGSVDLRDLARLQADLGLAGCGLGADLNENGRIDPDDWHWLVAEWNGPQP